MTVDEGRIFNLLRNVAEQYDEDTHILAGWLASLDHKIDLLEHRIANLDANDLTRKQEVHEAFALIDEIQAEEADFTIIQRRMNEIEKGIAAFVHTNRGSAQKTKLAPCPICKGRGAISNGLAGSILTGPKCAYCSGTGKINPDEVQAEIIDPQYERRIKETVEMGTALSEHLLQIENRLDSHGDWLSEVAKRVAICEVLLNSQADWSRVVDQRLTDLEAKEHLCQECGKCAVCHGSGRIYQGGTDLGPCTACSVQHQQPQPDTPFLVNPENMTIRRDGEKIWLTIHHPERDITLGASVNALQNLFAPTPQPDTLRELAESARAFIDAERQCHNGFPTEVITQQFYKTRADLFLLVSTILDNLPAAIPNDEEASE